MFIPMGPWPTREWNPILGCSMADHSCRNCYAAARVRMADPGNDAIRADGPRTFWTGRLRHAPGLWEMPLKEPEPCVVFAFSQSDLFHPGVGEQLIARAFHIMHRASHIQFNLLTKRPQRMLACAREWCEKHGALPANMRVGISAGTQRHLDERWLYLRDTPATLRILSLQPLLEQVHLPDDATGEKVGWVVVMAEVGPGARPMSVAAVRSLREECDGRGIPFFWEITSVDEPECAEERRRAMETGTPYAIQPRHSDRWHLRAF
jgi:protein gp37